MGENGLKVVHEDVGDDSYVSFTPLLAFSPFPLRDLRGYLSVISVVNDSRFI